MTTPYQVPSADDFLMGSGGGAATAKFPAIGHTVAGQITVKPTVEQQRDYDTEKPLFWEDGKPRMQLVVTMATNERDPENAEDDGTRRLFVKAHLQKAIAAAVRAVGANGLEVGGHLSVTYVANGEQTNPKKNPPKLYSAVYTSAATVTLHTPEPTLQQYPAAPAVQQYVPQAPAPQQYAPPVTAAPAMAPAMASPAPSPAPGLTAEQLANPAIQALIAQQQAQQAQPPLSPPPF